jgi:hypothetical protein
MEGRFEKQLDAVLERLAVYLRTGDAAGESGATART